MQTIPICGKCQLGMKPFCNGVTVIETAHNPPVPYKLWSADEWVCPECYAVVIGGFSEQSRRPSYEEIAYAHIHPDTVRLWKETSCAVDLDAMLERWLDAAEKDR